MNAYPSRPLTATRRCGYCGCAITAAATTCNRCRRIAAADRAEREGDVNAEVAALEAAQDADD